MTISLDIPGRGELALQHLVIDLNGTLTNRGEPIEGVAEILRRAAEALELTVLSADTFGALAAVGDELGVRTRRVASGEDKARFVWELGAERCVAIGNGANDGAMLEVAALGIAVVGPEGAAGAAVRSADVVCRSVVEALELLLDERALIATLRP